MGKNKKAPKRAFKKDPVATKVAAHGVKKTATKVVHTNLKKLNFQSKAKLDSLNAEFTKVEGMMVNRKDKDLSSKADKKATEAIFQDIKKSKVRPKEPDVDMAVAEFSKLNSASNSKPEPEPDDPELSKPSSSS